MNENEKVSTDVVAAKHDQSATTYDRMYETGGYEGVYELPYRHSSYFPLFKAVLRHLKNEQVESVLEVGCGSGAFAHYLVENTSIRYRGFDFSPVAVEKSRQRTARSDLFFTGDATKPESYVCDYEAIVCTEVLEHVPADLAVLRHWRSGTFCVCSVPNFDADTHERFFRSPAEVASRYGSEIEISGMSRVKKPPISDNSWKAYLRAIWWNRYRPARVAALLRISNFDDLGGWFVFWGHKK